MSVHSEYGRALEALLIGLRRLDTSEASEWTDALIKARASHAPDLSSAANVCIKVLDSIDEHRSFSSRAEIGPDRDPLREPYSNLRAHCQAVLGASAATADTGDTD